MHELRYFLLAFTLLFAALPGRLPAHAATVDGSIPGLKLSAAPYIVDVGTDVTLTLRATHWPAGAGVTVSFVSPHHGFSGKMPWRPACSCFQVTVVLARRQHSLELAHAFAHVRFNKQTASAGTTFEVRGLAHNGRDYAPGGRVFLTGWVSESTPLQLATLHVCGWDKTLDGLGVPNMPVTYVLHFQQHTVTLRGKTASPTGVGCVQDQIGHARIGYAVHVDIYSAQQHVTATFTPRK